MIHSITRRGGTIIQLTSFLRSLFFVMVASSACAADKPNLLIIYVDDLGYGDTAVYGHPVVQTPTIDSLAAEGVRFTQFYAPSALCSPSRAGLLTGRTPYRTGVESWIPDHSEVALNRQEETIADLVKTLGYRTAVIGKWHLNGGLDMAEAPQPRDFGFDYQYGLAAWVKNAEVEAAKADGVARSGRLYPDNMYRNNEPVGPTDKFSAELVTDEAISWVDKASADEPFFLLLTYSEVHAPIASPESWLDMYDSYRTQESRQFPWRYYFDFADRPYRGKGEYYANISYLDAQMGRFLDHLSARGILDDTIVIFSSDNGPVTRETAEAWELGLAGETDGLRGKKRYLFEGGIRVPGIVRWPGKVPVGSVEATPVSALDILPTVAEYLGAALPLDRKLDGISLVPLLDGKSETSLNRDAIFYWSIPTPDGMEYAVREGDWKMIFDAQGMPHYLFNLARDRYEVHNLLQREEKIAASLKKKFDNYRADVEQL